MLISLYPPDIFSLNSKNFIGNTRLRVETGYVRGWDPWTTLRLQLSPGTPLFRGVDPGTLSMLFAFGKQAL
jgi:hypothetical protein